MASPNNNNSLHLRIELPGWAAEKYIAEAALAKAFRADPDQAPWHIFRAQLIAYIRHNFSSYDQIYPSLTSKEVELLRAVINKRITSQLPWLKADAPDPRKPKKARLSMARMLDRCTLGMREASQALRTSKDPEQRQYGHDLARFLDGVIAKTHLPGVLVYHADEPDRRPYFLGLEIYPNSYRFLGGSCQACGARIAVLNKYHRCCGARYRVSACYCCCVLSPVELEEIKWPGRGGLSQASM